LKELFSALNEYSQESVRKALEQYVHKEIYAKSYPSPFIGKDEDWSSDSAAQLQRVQEHGDWNFKIRVARIVMIISIVTILLLIATPRLVGTSMLLGIGLLIMFSVYFTIIAYYVFSCSLPEGSLYRIYSVSDRPENWLTLKTGHLQYLYRGESIQSISELSAINGGVTKVMLNTIGAYSWTVIMCHYAAELYYNKCIFRWDIVDVLEIMGTAGLLFISIFELDPFSKKMQICHYIGAALGCGTIAGFVIQQWYYEKLFWLSVAIAVVATIAFVLWQLTGFATNAAQYENKKKWNKDFKLHCQCLIPPCFRNKSVNTYSRMNIGFEAVFLYLGALCLCLWLMHYNYSCKVGCAGLYDEEQKIACVEWYSETWWQ